MARFRRSLRRAKRGLRRRGRYRSRTALRFGRRRGAGGRTAINPAYPIQRRVSARSRTYVPPMGRVRRIGPSSDDFGEICKLDFTEMYSVAVNNASTINGSLAFTGQASLFFAVNAGAPGYCADFYRLFKNFEQFRILGFKLEITPMYQTLDPSQFRVSFLRQESFSLVSIDVEPHATISQAYPVVPIAYPIASNFQDNISIPSFRPAKLTVPATQGFPSDVPSRACFKRYVSSPKDTMITNPSVAPNQKWNSRNATIPPLAVDIPAIDFVQRDFGIGLWCAQIIATNNTGANVSLRWRVKHTLWVSFKDRIPVAAPTGSLATVAEPSAVYVVGAPIA